MSDSLLLPLASFWVPVGQDSLTEGLRTAEDCLYFKLTGQSPDSFKFLLPAHAC